jgi:serine/threonine-protein kinase
MSAPTSEIPATLDPDLAVGQVIGEYEIDGVVGQGGFGTVYRAVHPLIGKVVAIKVLARKYSVDPEMVSRFIAEARSVNQIRHRHIIDIFLFGTLDDGRAYYVMEYLDGEPLDAMIDRLGRVPLPLALPILRAMARALDAAHAKGITHRDLKPENIFLQRDPDGGAGWPKLLDFGIAKLMGMEDGQKHKTRTGIPIGTPYYMSPEQCRGKDVDHRTDYYAFGVVAYQMLTGVHPIDADDYMTIMMRQLSDEPAAPSTLAPELPDGIDDAIAWLMKKDREQRPPNLVTAMRAFEQAAEASGIAIPRPSSAWDAATPPPDGRDGRAATPAPRSPTAPTHTAGLANTMPSGAAIELPVEPERPARSRLPLVIGAGAVVIAAVIVVAFARPHDSTSAPTPPAAIAGSGAGSAVATMPPPVAPDAVTNAPPASAIITVDGVPDGTEVSIAGTPIGVAPGPVQVPHAASVVVLTFKADGFLPTSKTVTPDRDQRLEVQLKKKPSGAGGTRPWKPNKDDIIDVFGGKKQP